MFRCREVLDNTVSVIKNALSACLIDRDRMAVGTEDGLFCVDLDRDGESNTKSILERTVDLRMIFLQKSVALETRKRSTRSSTFMRSSS